MAAVKVILAIVLLAGGAAVILNLGGITSGDIDAVRRGDIRLSRVMARVPPGSWLQARPRRDEARHWRRQLIVARTSGLFFLVVGLVAILAASRG